LKILFNCLSILISTMEYIYPVILIDSLMVTYLSWKMIKAIIWHKQWSKFGCTEPFGFFIIVQCLNIIIFRLFYYLERRYQYRRILARLTQDAELYERAWAKVRIMRGLKYIASFCFLTLTALATLWYFQDHQSCHYVLRNDLRNWVILSWGFCFVYFAMLIWDRKSGLSSEHDIELVHRINWVEALRIFGNRREELKEGLSEGLSEQEIQSIEKLQLSRIAELKMIVTWSEDCEASDEFHAVCAICIENIKVNEWYKQLPQCEHYFHADCIDGWLRLRDSCPLCRQTVEILELVSSSGLSDVETVPEE